MGGEAGNERVKELADFHVLSYITRCVPKLVLDKRISPCLLDQVYNAFEMPVLTCIVQGCVLIEVLHILVDWWLVRAFDYRADYVGVPTDRRKMKRGSIDRRHRLSLDV